MKVCTASICLRNHAKLSILVLTTAFLLTVDCRYLCEADAVVTQVQGHTPVHHKHGRHWKLPSL